MARDMMKSIDTHLSTTDWSNYYKNSNKMQEILNGWLKKLLSSRKTEPKMKLSQATTEQ